MNFFIFIPLCCTMCSRLSSKTTFACVLTKWNTALCLWVVPLLPRTKCQEKELPVLSGIQGPKLPSVMTNINKHVLNLSVPYSDLYWLAESPCAELQFLKLTDFFIPVQVSWKCVYMIGKRRLLPLPELQLSLACGLKLPTIDKCRQGLYKKSGGLLPVQ